MPVGTLATVKGISTEQLAQTGAQMVLSNTYHLHLQPGEAVVSEAGGLHRFMGWNGPMLTDSGGFQVFSLGDLNRIDDRGVVFRNPRDGRTIDMTPENATDIQMDGTGRLLLPAPLREYALMEKKLVLLGQINKIEIWSESHWLSRREQLIAVKDESGEGDQPDFLETLSL